MVAIRTGQYVLLPRVGLTAGAGPAMAMLVNLPSVSSPAPPREDVLRVAGSHPVRIIDTVQENGPKLVELSDEAASAVNGADSPLRALPVVEYTVPDPHLHPLSGPSATLAAANAVRVTCTDALTGAPISGATIVAFTSFALKLGGEGTTDGAGQVTLALTGVTIERLYAYPPAGFWGAFRQNIPIQPAIAVTMTPVDLTFTDAVRGYYGNSNFQPATGVTVGVLDTGVGPHTGLNVVGGRNTVTGEPPNNFLDGHYHGTHVAGLIGANGSPPTGVRGVAPNVPIRAYRVFAQGGTGATNYAILKAMIMAANDGCDIINLSLGGGPHDLIVEEAVDDARNQGMLVVIAAGNDGRKAVSYPGAYQGATTVSALGKEGTFPAGSLDEGEILRPPINTFPDEFIAAFSNVGPQVAVTAPGVGCLSTLPNNAFGPLSGTSMAAPVAAGAAACLLSRDATTFSMSRNRARSNAIERLLQTNCVSRGFGLIYEGFGLPNPATV